MLERLVLAPRDRRIDFMIVALVAGGAVRERLLQAGIPVETLNMRRGLPDPRAVWRLVKLIRRERPDVIQSWLYHGDLMATLALILSGRRKGTKLFWNVRCSSMEGGQRSLGQKFARTACTLLSPIPDAVIANSQAGKDFHCALGYRPRSFPVIENGIDTSTFRPDETARREVRRELGVAESRPLLAMLARVDPVKGYPSFLRALTKLPDVAALAIGSGTAKLDRLPNLYCLGERSDVPRLLAACDFVISTSTSEGFPNAILEGMACGLPAVATDAGDSRRLIGDTGIVVPVGDVVALVAAIGRLTGETPEGHAARSRAARSRAIEEFSLARMAAGFDALYWGTA